MKNLTQKTSTAHESKFWGGKNSGDAPKDGDMAGAKADGPNAGADLSRDRKDNDHQKYYKNHNDAEKFEALPEKEREARAKAEKQAGNLAGKSSTDDVPTHYDNQKSQKPEVKEKQQEEYSGSSNTDKLRNLGSKEKIEAEAKQGKDLDGKSSTDKIDSHYGGPKEKPQTPEEREHERKEKEEKLFKERLQTAERNKAEHAERERKLKEDREQTKEKNERAREEKEQASIKKKQLEAKEETETRKAQVEAREQAETKKKEAQEKEAAKSKTAVEKGWVGDQDYE